MKENFLPWYLFALCCGVAIGYILAVPFPPTPSITATSIAPTSVTFATRPLTPLFYSEGVKHTACYINGEISFVEIDFAARTAICTLDHKSILDADNIMPTATQDNLYEINLRLNALDGGKVTSWKCRRAAGASISFPDDSNGYFPLTTVGKETPAQFGYSSCTLRP